MKCHKLLFSNYLCAPPGETFAIGKRLQNCQKMFILYLGQG